MKDGFIKVAAAVPAVKVANTKFNCESCISLAHKASDAGVKVLLFPELALTGYSCGDLFSTDTLLDGALSALREYIYATAMLDMVSVIGLPISFSDRSITVPLSFRAVSFSVLCPRRIFLPIWRLMRREYSHLLPTIILHTCLTIA